MSDLVDLRFQSGAMILVFGDVRLSAGLGQHQLVLPFSHSATWLGDDHQANTAVLVAARVYATNNGMKWVGEAPTRAYTTRSFQVNDELLVPLHDGALLSLDADRGRDDLQLTVQLIGTLLHMPATVHPTMDAQIMLRIKEADWLRELDRAGNELGILVRVPSPLVDPGGAPTPPLQPGVAAMASRSQATARLRQARTELQDGQYENCVATCRLVLDSIQLLAPLPAAKLVFDKRAADRSQEERWAALQHDVHSLLSAAHHDDNVTRDFTWLRTDAQAVLAIVSVLVVRAFR